MGTTNRNYGVDLLRIVSMMMVVVLHVMAHGGILGTAPAGSWTYRISWGYEVAAYCAVNCYALISGYVAEYNHFRLSKVIKLWLQVIFYTIGITVLFFIFDPSCFSVDLIKKAIFPIMTSQYWYVTAYFGVMMLMPVLNPGIKYLEKREALLGVILIMGIIVVMEFHFMPGNFMLNNGYSLVWLVILYVLGGCLKKSEIFSRLDKRLWLLVYALCVLSTWLMQINGNGTQVNYISPLIVLCSIGLTGFFASLTITNKQMIKMISVFSPATLGVYLLHVHPLTWAKTTGMTAFLARFGWAGVFLGVPVVTIIVFFICASVDLFRIWLHKVLRIDQPLAKMEKALAKKAEEQ